MSSVLLTEAIPELAAELAALLDAAGERELAAQVPELRLVDRCRCGDDFCATMYTRRPPAEGWGPGHETLALDEADGYVILDLVDRKIACIEVLFRETIRNRLLALFP